jgi:hypothetical protein
VRVRFDLALTNRLQASDLVASTFPSPPAPQVVAFPFTTNPSGLFGLAVVASDDWNGTGAIGSGAPWNFFNDPVCIALTPPGDCFRWESFGAVVPAGSTTASHRVGFDVDPTITNFTVYVAIAADIHELSVPRGAAAIAGNITSIDRGALDGVSVTVAGTTTVTNVDGRYGIAALPEGSASITLGALPVECENPGPQSVTLVSSQVADGSVHVTCRGRIAGRVTSSGLPSVGGLVVSVLGTTNTAVTNSTGEYLLAGLAAGPTTLTVTGLPEDCFEPRMTVAVPGGRTVTAPDLVITCLPERIAFVAPDEAGINHIFIMNIDGTGRRQLTFGPDGDLFPSISPDGSTVAFNRGNPFELYTIGVDGSGETSQNLGISWPRPRWMRDGLRVVTFNAKGVQGQRVNTLELYRVGTGPDGLQPIAGGAFLGGAPSAAYSDNRIAYARSPSPALDQSAIYLLDTDNTAAGEAELLLDAPRPVGGISWAPDGSRVIFVSDGAVGDILTRSTEQSGTTTVLTSGPENYQSPVYSRNGKYIYFLRDGALCRMRADGSEVTQILSAAAFGGASIDVR